MGKELSEMTLEVFFPSEDIYGHQGNQERF